MAVISKDQAAQRMAHELLIELLAYQFAFPVRWIETQNHLFNCDHTVKRFIEIGPATVLATMAKKTAQRKFAARDASKSTEREFLSHAGNPREIYYEYEEVPPVTSTPAVDALSPSAPAVAIPTPPVAASITPNPQPVASVAIPDTDISATDVVLSIVAQKLKKSFEQLSLQKTIRDLSAGKSTLQNELIGDLGAEFGNLPDGSEDLSLESLGSALASNFSGQPGKQMQRLIERFLSSKMPAGFNQPAIREHLQTRWGLPPQRQTAILCFAVTMEPAVRLEGGDAGKQFFDTVTAQYGAHAGVSLSPQQSSGGSVSASSSVQVDAAGLEALKKQQNEYLMKQFQVLANYLQVEGDIALDKLAEVQAHQRAADDKLAQWGAEFDEDFFVGVRSTFDARKVRQYDSWWNWAREDLLSLLHESDVGSRVVDLEPHIQGLLNRWTPALQEMLHYHTIKDRHQASISNLLLERRALYNSEHPLYRYTLPSLAPKTVVEPDGRIVYSEAPRKSPFGVQSYYRVVEHGRSIPGSTDRISYVHIRSRSGESWTFDPTLTKSYLDELAHGTDVGLSFSGKTALVTGAGPGSIGAEIVRGLLSGGARVFVTTSRPPSTTAKFYNAMYKECGACGSELAVLPFNQASKKDCEDLIAHIYGGTSRPDEDLDFIVPFAAIPESGRELDGLDGKSELAHRAMLVNLLRLLGYIKKQKESRGYSSRPTHVILPLSPNHGTFGGDGLYSESKLGLETLFNRFQSENWSAFLAITGAVIGWTRGTGLMSANNIVAEGIEGLDILTFTPSEMAFNILALMSPKLSSLADDSPLYADLSGGLQFLDNLKESLTAIRRAITTKSKVRKALAAENLRERAVLQGANASPATPSSAVGRGRSNIQLGFPSLPDHGTVINQLESLRGMVDLSRTVVVVGYSELGPWGSSRTRWEMEHLGHFTQNGLTEMSWIMGLVKHFNGDIKGQSYVGWVDARTQEPVHEADFESKYGEHIRSHSGIRFIDPALLDGYDPGKKEFLQEMVVEEDLPEFEAAQAVAEAFKLKHGNKVTIRPGLSEGDAWKVTVKKGAIFLVPKAVPFDRFVAGQLPSGWDPAKYGIPEEIISQVDPNTLYVLCCVCEAMYSAGIEDPFELYKHIHVSELANCIGTGVGGLLAIRGVYRDRYLDRPIQSDILQESFPNAINAWTNMLLLASAGPIKTPSGTCATAVESMDIGCEAIRSGQVKVALVGGTDDFQEEMSYEFANMKATANAQEELEKGRLPTEMSRPTASSRSGFVESAGCGVQILMNAEMALAMGLPIYSIVAYTQMAGDKVGRSVPAPGQGILTAARETDTVQSCPLLDINYRRQQLNAAVADIHKWRLAQLQNAPRQPEEMTEFIRTVNVTASCKIRDAQSMWNGDIRRQDPNIAPMRAGLAAWGLTIDDIQVASLHGTSTKANDKNESNVINQQMEHLGRTKGNPLLAICQKYLTGHPKGAAGAWMFNSCQQVLQTGIVPGNRNADNVDHALVQFEHLAYPSRTIRTSGIKAFMLTSFGFGQKGGLVVGVAPKYLFSAIDAERYEDYRVRAQQRQRQTNSAYLQGMLGGSLFKAKDHSAWAVEDESAVFLNPEARVRGKAAGQYQFNTTALRSAKSSTALDHGVSSRDLNSQQTLSSVADKWIQGALAHDNPAATVGVDIEPFSSINMENDTFLNRNFTANEQSYCYKSPDPRASFAGRWAAKEAIFKTLHTKSKGPGASMREIEVLSEGGIPIPKLHESAKKAAEAAGIWDIQISITHAAETAMAVALARR